MNKSEKTKQKAADALIEMLQRHPLDRITVKDLTQKANIGRTAFYNNFANLEDVLKYVYQKAHQETFRNRFEEESYIFSKQYVRDMIAFFDANSNLLLALYRWNLIDMIAKYDTELCIAYAKDYSWKPAKKHPMLVTIYTGSPLFNACTQWIINGKQESPQQLCDLLLSYRKMLGD